MSILRRSYILATIAALLVSAHNLLADGARFDLAGPKVEVRVTRDGVTLPIAQVPNLKAGDKIWLHPDFPPTQSVKYLLVAAFLRGTTNPPPDSWFTRIETWNKGVQNEGVFITVPDEAQQVILFLAPETGGDFGTLRSAVKGRPGIFVRASQDLNEAGFEQARIEKYLEGMKTVDPNDAKALSEHSTLLARTLALKPNENCFKQPVDAQYNCLTQSGNQLLLDDGHGQTVAAALSNGPTSDFILQASNTSMVGGGLYSAYVGAIVDLVRLTSSLHTAQYQYIPAIAFPSEQQLNLRLNAPPSFHNPKSVIVIGLPGIQAATPPPLRAADAKQVACLLRPDLVLGLEGAPLVYSTSFAHELTLHINSSDHVPDVPLTPDAFRGGLIVSHETHREMLPAASPDDTGIVTVPSTNPVDQAKVASSSDSKIVSGVTFPQGTLTGTVSGLWGFDHFTGPTLPLQNVPGKGWKLVTTDPLIVGQDNHLTLTSTGTACVQAVISDSVPGTETKLDWKPAGKLDEISLTLPLKSLNKDSVELAIKQYGAPSLDKVTAKTYSEPAKLESLNIHAGDAAATLSGSSLDQVKQLELKGLIFTPAPNHDTAQASDSKGDLQLTLDIKSSGAKAVDSKTATPKLSPGDKLTATATLKDGRTLTLPFTVGGARPSITLLSKGIDQPKSSAIHLSPDDLPINEKLTFFLKTSDNYPRGQQIEIASTDDSLHTKLSIADGNLVLQNKHTVLATLEPLKTFGPSAFGPLHVRAVAPDGTAGDWIPLATVVRLPTLTDLHCSARAKQPCTLDGSDLYLVDSFSIDQAFTTPTQVPEGFVGNSVMIPHPTENTQRADITFYIRLRDDPSTTNQVTLPMLPIPAPVQPVQGGPVIPSQSSATNTAVPPTR
jgi:hypothetical protein